MVAILKAFEEPPEQSPRCRAGQGRHDGRPDFNFFRRFANISKKMQIFQILQKTFSSSVIFLWADANPLQPALQPLPLLFDLLAN